MKKERIYMIIGTFSLILGAVGYMLLFPVKANGKSHIYHIFGCQSYGDTIIGNDPDDRIFYLESSAKKAGFRKAKNCY